MSISVLYFLVVNDLSYLILSNELIIVEVHILWAQHQVHHTSEDFNMGIGIRQSALQGWCGFVSKFQILALE